MQNFKRDADNSDPNNFLIHLSLPLSSRNHNPSDTARFASGMTIPASLALCVRNELGAVFCQLMLCQFQDNARSQLCTSGSCNKLQAAWFFPIWKQIAFRDRKQAARGRVATCTTRCTCCWDQYLFLVKVPMTFVQLELSPPHTPHLSYWSLDPMMPSQPVRMHFPRTQTELL